MIFSSFIKCCSIGVSSICADKKILLLLLLILYKHIMVLLLLFSERSTHYHNSRKAMELNLLKQTLFEVNIQYTYN